MELLLLHHAPLWKQPLLAYCRAQWPKVADELFCSDVERSMAPDPLPVTGLLLLDGALSGFYQLTAHEPLARKDLTPWVGLVHVHPDCRGRGLCAVLLNHARREAGRLGFSTIYLASEHRGLYEKCGWQSIGSTTMDWGTPTGLFTCGT